MIKLNVHILGKVSASACPKYAKDGLCDCGNLLCNFTNNEYIDPSTCSCKSPKGKRSIEERDLNDKEIDKYASHDNYQPSVKFNFRSIQKRSHKVNKRGAGKSNVKLPYQGDVRKRDTTPRRISGHTE